MRKEPLQRGVVVISHRTAVITLARPPLASSPCSSLNIPPSDRRVGRCAGRVDCFCRLDGRTPLVGCSRRHLVFVHAVVSARRT